MSSGVLLGADVGEVFEPAFGEGGRDVGFLVVFLDGFAPVETDITIGEAARSVNEHSKLFDAAMQREHLFYDEGFACVVGRKGDEGLFDLAFFGVEVDAGEIEISGDLI